MDNTQVIDLMDETVQPKSKETKRCGRIKSKHRRTVKEEMQTLHLNDDSQKQIMDTLRYIHGPNFELTDISKYKNKKSRFKDQFWENAGNLIIKSAFDYSQNAFVLTPKEEFRMYSVNKLKSYGFHETHCIEALEYCEDDTDAALRILYNKYHCIDDTNAHINSDMNDLTIDELLQQRIDEKDVLESIYDRGFNEKIPNKLWILTFQLNYLIEQYSNVKQTENINKSTSSNKSSKQQIDKCRNFLRTGQCKYGNKCRFSHEQENIEKQIKNDEQQYQFDLEIHFDNNSKYPYEPPTMILLTTNFTKIPKITLLYVCGKLISEAKQCARNGIVSVYSMCELLQQSNDIMDYLNTTPVRFIDEYQSLFGNNQLDDDSEQNSHLPTHYERNMKIKKSQSNKNYHQQNRILFNEYANKQSNTKYQTFLNTRKSLPAWNKRDEILNIIQSHQVILISGETGCGKSTQIPQYILDNWLSSSSSSSNGNDNAPTQHVDVICTQPRRLSAIGVAERVASERVERVGDTIGYQIRLETKVSDLTRLTFCTTGILLMRLQSDPYLNSITHIIVDEVHERSDESDFLLLILRRILTKRSDLKIILMSATLNAKLFSDYFGGIPIIEIPGRTFPVQPYFLEDILDETNYVLEENSPFARTDVKTSDLEEQLATCEVLKDNQQPSPGIKDYKLSLSQILARYCEYSKLTCKNLYLMDQNKINMELIESTLMWIIFGNHNHPKDGTILIFLPGYAEITTLLEFLSNNTNFSTRQRDFLILPLHSSLSNEEQSLIFKKPKNGARKIILSTNIAETSITIDDCTFVIDCGKMKEKRFDSNKNMESLDTVWISRANAMQRRGRAGRVMPGVCIHLYTSFTFKQFIHQPVPELHRIPLEQIILRIKVLPSFIDNSIQSVLDETIEPPSTENVESSIYRLQDVGALDEDEELTPLGHHLATLPVDVRIGKIMLYGAIFCCVDSSLTIAACLSYKSPFVAPFLQKKEGDAKKKEFITANSDQLTVLKAYKKWKMVAERGSQASYNFAQENYLSQRTLITLSDIKHQLLDLLVNIGFVPLTQKIQRRTGQDKVLEMTGSQMNENGENSKLLAGVLCAALYPNIIKVLTPGKSYQKCIGGALPTVTEHDDLKFITLEDGNIAIHPSSVNSKIGTFSSPYLLYQEKVKTSRLFVRETCMVPPLCLALFAGCDLHIEVHSGTSIISLDDGWIIFRTETHEIAEMLKTIRIELNKLLEEKIKDPSLNLLHLNQGKRIISTIINVISVNS